MTVTDTAEATAYHAALDRVRDYRAQLDSADRQADQNSLDRAADLELIYQAMQWVDDLPAPKHQVWRGRPVDPQSRNRFATWVLQQTGLTPSTVTKLHKAHEVLGIIGNASTVIPNSARALNPFGRLRRAGYGERIPDVYKMAVQLAEGRPPTSTETSQAVRDFLAQWSPQQRRDANKAETAKRHRLKAQTAVQVLIDDKDSAQFALFAEWFAQRAQ